LADVSVYQREISQPRSVVWQGSRMDRAFPTLACVVVGLIAACGAVKGETPDAAVDADVPMRVTATVLTLAADGQPDTTAKVVFQDPEGTVVSDGAVDTMGRAEAMMPSGGSVTAIRVTTDTPTTLSATIETTTGVKPGDDLTFGLKAPGTILNQGGQTTMTASFTPLANATSYVFYTSCGVTSTTVSPVTLTFRDSCHGATFDLVGIATGAMLTTPAYVRLTNIAYQSGGSFNVPVSFLTMQTFTINVSNIAAEISSLSATRSAMFGNVPVAPRSVSAGDPPAGSSSVSIPYPPAVGSRSEVVLSMSRPDAQSTQRHEMHTATLTSNVSIDLAQQPLPWLGNATQTPMGATWTAVVPGSADGMLTQWSGRWTVGTRTVTVTWRVTQPAEMTGMTLPGLPPAYAMLDATRQTATPLSLVLYMAEYDNLAGYDELRQMPETLLTPSIGSMGAFVGMPFQRRITTLVR
jgi:hypothetical protein